ncbi:hypothetical protein BGX29_012122 [Mortierella sp. GBA35]|nr:hypothetical protein BGX29_012122 [Mortierella sp. GBA35]
MDAAKAPLGSCFRTVGTFLAMRRSRRFLLAFPIVIGIFLILSIQTLDVIDLALLPGHDNVDIHGKPVMEKNNRWRGHTIAKEVEIPDATWTCTDDNLSQEEKDTQKNRRTRQCVVQNLCVDRKGGFIRSSSWLPESMPEINLLSSDTTTDMYWRPRVRRFRSRTMKAHYVDETLFVHGLYSPDHFSHWLYNGMMPLYSTTKQFNGTKDSWTFRAKGLYNDNNSNRQGKWEMDHVFQTGLELVLSQDELATDFQTLPPEDAPICFRTAVIGLGNQCALYSCEVNIPAEVYGSFRDVVSDYYWRTPQTWERHLHTMQENIDIAARILQQQRVAAGESVADIDPTFQKTPLKCLDLVRYYNFEPSTGQDPLQALKESKNRVGQLFPDTVDPEVDQSSGKRRLVVAIIQREGSRRVINDQELAESLASAGFRVKWITLDHGCGLAETAYLLRDVHVLATPHGNAIGSSIFMPSFNPVPTVISIDPSRYSESWFINTAMAMGQRFIQTVCGPNGYLDEATKTRCPYYKNMAGTDKVFKGRSKNLVLGLTDEMAKEYREKSASGQLTPETIRELRDYVERSPSAQQLAREELDLLIGPEVPISLVQKYGDKEVWLYLEIFWRDAPRYADVPRVVALMHELQQDQEQEQSVASGAAPGAAHSTAVGYEQYFGYIRENRACGVKYCRLILNRNVLLESRVFGLHSIDDPSRWGQTAVDTRTLLQGLEDPQNWRPDSLLLPL